MTSLPILLAIETSQRIGGVALRDSGGTILIEMLQESKRHDDDLMPAIKRIFERADLQPSDLEAVGVSMGPGGFTGLRIAISTAKMFAETLGVKLIAVPSAVVVAESHSETHEDHLLVALASKGETCWVTCLERQGEHWQIRGEPSLSDASHIGRFSSPVLLGDQYLPSSIREKCEQDGVNIFPPVFDPKACLKAASQQLKQGETCDPLSLSPLYPRPPEAVSLWEKRRKKGQDV